MIERLMKDAAERPRVFEWRGPIEAERVNLWSQSSSVRIPLDLRQLWIATGGGGIFESETILSPSEDDSEYSIASANQSFWNSGGQRNLLLFHTGTWISAVRSERPFYVSMETETFTTVAEFEDLDSWYVGLVRKVKPASSDDFNRLVTWEAALIEDLATSAEVDGHDLGSGEFNIFIFTDDPSGTFRRIQGVPETSSVSPSMAAAYRPVDGEDYIVLWPRDLERIKIA